MSAARDRMVEAALAAGWPGVKLQTILDAVEPVIREDERERVAHELRQGGWDGGPAEFVDELGAA